MHYHGPIVRPQTDADSIFIEVTIGCTYDKCTFCNFYKDYPFSVANIEDVEADLKEAAAMYPHAKKVWASGGNPYALSPEKLADLAILFKKYLPEARISTYARIDDLFNKTVEDIRDLKDLGWEDIVIGIESGDDEVLDHVKKGYTAQDILDQCHKLEEAGVAYRIIYLGGLAGLDKCKESARRSAEIINQIHPYYMYLTTAAVLPGTPLYEEMMAGDFKDATELERIEEFRELIAHLDNHITVFSQTSTNMVPFTVTLPEQKESILKELDKVIANFTAQDEAYLHAIRSRMQSV